ncbi:hypothetical protein DSBG_1177 [Desulfosporosinus sp. BG]|nr:hypothetical protein DSBG_1177 [Desulfosporosinus sp. BG]
MKLTEIFITIVYNKLKKPWICQSRASKMIKAVHDAGVN